MMIADKPHSPEADLIAAILMQAYRDLFIPVKKSGIAPIDRQKALAFLTDDTGGHATHRNNLCSLIGWDGDMLAERIRRMLDGEDFPVVPRDATPAARKRQLEAENILREQWRDRPRPPHTPRPGATDQLQLVAHG